MDAGVLHEREAEVEVMSDALAAAASGSGGVVFIEGPGGIGKSRLLGALRALAPTRMRVLDAVGVELEQSFAFGAVRQLFEREVRGRRGLLDGAAELAAPLFEPGDAATDVTADMLFARLHGLTWLLANLGDEAPLALVVDDAHWADEASLRALAFLGRRLEDQRVLLAVAARPSSHVPLEELRRVPGARALSLDVLSAAAVEAWFEETLAARPDPEFVDAVVTATGGNPFLVSELLNELRAGEVAPSAGAARRVAALGPSGVARSVLMRLAYLPAPAADVAHALAILGDGRPLPELAAFIDAPEADVGHAAAELERAGIVDGHAGLRFLHPIIRTAIHDDMARVERRIAHARAAVFLRERGARADEVSAHLLESDPRGDAQAVALLRAVAADASVAGDPAGAARLLRRARAEGAGFESAPMLELATAAALAGDADAEALLEEAVEAAGTPEQRVLAALRLVAFGATAGSAVAIDRLEAALEPLPSGTRWPRWPTRRWSRSASGRSPPVAACTRATPRCR
jgi:hypothetical protein